MSSPECDPKVLQLIRRLRVVIRQRIRRLGKSEREGAVGENLVDAEQLASELLSKWERLPVRTRRQKIMLMITLCGWGVVFGKMRGSKGEV